MILNLHTARAALQHSPLSIAPIPFMTGSIGVRVHSYVRKRRLSKSSNNQDSLFEGPSVFCQAPLRRGRGVAASSRILL
ncbi:hypothetical protein BDV11DRAFT_185024 [Aspergillus similis]